MAQSDIKVRISERKTKNIFKNGASALIPSFANYWDSFSYPRKQQFAKCFLFDNKRFCGNAQQWLHDIEWTFLSTKAQGNLFLDTFAAFSLSHQFHGRD